MLTDSDRETLTTRLTQAELAAREKRLHEAVGICNDIIDTHPTYAPALAVLGAIEGHRGNLDTAAALLEQAIALEPANAAWHGNLSGIYRVQYKLDAALASAREAARLAPGQARNFVNLAKVLLDRNERNDAVTCFMAALIRETNNAEAHLGIGQILLAEGNFRPGWIEYEWRNQLDAAQGIMPKMVTPVWNGMTLPRERILLVGDQGYGDSIQFARYIPHVAERCGELVIGCSPDLAPLFQTIKGVAGVYSRWDDIPPHVAHSLLSSLPGILGTELHTIPTQIPYLTIDDATQQIWQSRLAPLRPNRLVGIVWAGRPTHPNDGRRSLRLSDLAPLAQTPNTTLVSLQKPLPPRDADQFAALNLQDYSNDFTDFAQTAAAIQALDLVITIDSAVAHLCGALNKPCWVLTPTPSDWRWMHTRTDTPWYPSLRLFRQPTPGDWISVMAEITAALAQLPTISHGN